MLYDDAGSQYLYGIILTLLTFMIKKVSLVFQSGTFRKQKYCSELKPEILITITAFIGFSCLRLHGFLQYYSSTISIVL